MNGRIKYTIFLLFGFIASAFSQFTADQGVLDLRKVDFNQHNMIPLTGEWEFYWNKIYSLSTLNSPGFRDEPDYVNYMTRWRNLPQLQDATHGFGYATLRLKILCSENMPSMTLYLPEVYTAYDLYVNGEGFEGNGTVGRDRSSSQPYWRPSSKVVNLKPGENELVMHISNFHHHRGGANRPIILGTSDQINYWRNFKISSTLFLAGCLLIAGALAFGFYWFNPTDYTGLFFFLFCASYMYRLLGTDEYVIHRLQNVPWSLTLRLEYISLYASVIFYTYFIRNLIQPRVKLVVLHTVAVVSGILTLLTIVFPTEIFTSFLSYYLAFLALAITGIGFAYMIRLNLTHKTTYITLIGGITLFVVVFQKILEYYRLTDENMMLTTFCYVIFICSQAIAMTIRFGRNFRESHAAAQIAAKSKDQFLNTMSHELRTPMNAILGMTDMLESSSLNAEQKEKVGTIRKNGESLLAIIMDILSLTDAGSGKLSLQNQELNVEDCITSAYNLAVKEKRVKVEFTKEIDNNIPTELIGDAIRLKQILMHLLSNAFKFTDDGMVKIRAERIGETAGEAEIKFTVEDTGIGINQSKLGNIFSIFSQADSSNNRRFGGAGLGLTVVKQLVELMGGSLHIKSEVGKGTVFTFTITLEVAAGKAKAKGKSYRPTQIDTSLRILYAEDNMVNQKLLTMMMKSLGIDIDVASNGKEAWEMAKSGNYHIILMDVQMPEMDGIEATKRIVQDVPMRPIIIAVTANATTSDKKDCFEAGMNDFITKPIKAGDLKEGILKWQSLCKFMGDDKGKSEPRYIQLSS